MNIPQASLKKIGQQQTIETGLIGLMEIFQLEEWEKNDVLRQEKLRPKVL